MAGSPQIPQGTLNRLRGSVIIPAFPELTITAPFLMREGIRIAFEGDSTVAYPTLTGTAQSPEPYLIASVSIYLLKTNGLAQLFKQQIEKDALIGDFTVIPDTSALQPYQINNGAIEGAPREVSFNGQDPGFMLMLKGFYTINNALWGSS